MKSLRLLVDIFVWDPCFVHTEMGWLSFLSYEDVKNGYEGADACFSADGALDPLPALRQLVQSRAYWAAEIHPWQGARYNGEWPMFFHAPNGGSFKRAGFIPVTITEHGLMTDLTREGSL